MSLGSSDTIKTFRGFRGINNVNNPISLTDRDLVKAENVDIDDKGLVSVRKGETLLKSGDYRWIWSDGLTCLAVYDSDLVSVAASFASHTVLQSGVGNTRMVYEKVLDRIYFTNSRVIGYIQQGVAYDLPTPTENFKVPLPPGSFLKFRNARLWVGSGSQMIPSDVLSIGQMDSRVAPKSFPAPITLMEPMDSGWFVAAGETYFWETQDPLEPGGPKSIAPYNAIPHTSIRVPGDRIKSQTPIKGEVLLWASEQGVCMGLEDGSFVNLTSKYYLLPENVDSGAVIYRKNHKGTNQVLMTLQQ